MRRAGLREAEAELQSEPHWDESGPSRRCPATATLSAAGRQFSWNTLPTGARKHRRPGRRLRREIGVRIPGLGVRSRSSVTLRIVLLVAERFQILGAMQEAHRRHPFCNDRVKKYTPKSNKAEPTLSAKHSSVFHHN